MVNTTKVGTTLGDGELGLKDVVGDLIMTTESGKKKIRKDT